MTQFTTQAVERTQVVSTNTDSVFVQIKPGDEERVRQVIADWEQQFQFRMARAEVLAHRELNINSYIEIVREGKGAGEGEPEIKSKGLLAHDPGISADHDRVIVNQAVAQWMRDGTEVEVTIQQAAANREILKFTEMRSAPSSGLRVGGQPIGRLARVYRSTRQDLPRLTKDATGAAAEQKLEDGFAYLPGTEWPVAEDVDIHWYVRQARLLIAQTDVPYSPHHNRLAQELQALGLTVAGQGGAATVLSGEDIDEQALARGTDKRPRNFSGDRALAVSVAKSSGVVALPPGVGTAESLVLAYGKADGTVLGELHDCARLTATKGSLAKLKQAAAWMVDAGYVVVYDPAADVLPLGRGEPARKPETKSFAKSVSEVVKEAAPAQESAPAVDPAALTNDEFLQVMFGADAGRAFVCSNLTPPDTEDEAARRRMWIGGTVEHSKGRYRDPDRQNYTCVSAFKLHQEGVYRRQQQNFAGLYFIVLDDIGTKVQVDPRTLGFPEPTLINETSPGNFQWLYRLREPITDLSLASYLTKDVLSMPVQGHLLTDQGSKGVTRLCKLPQGMNLKLALKTPWHNRVVSWRPDLSYDAQEIAGWFGGDLKRAPTVCAATAAAAGESESHPLIRALVAEGRLLSGQKSSGWWDFECIQLDEHTNGVASGTAVKVREDGSWTMKCQHGHCTELTPTDLFYWLRERGHDLTHPQDRDDVRRLNRIRLEFNAVDAGSSDQRAGETVDSAEDSAEVTGGDKTADGGGSRRSGVGARGRGGSRKMPKIFIKPGYIDKVVAECAVLLSEEVYKRGNSLVRIGQAREAADRVRRSRVQQVVVPVNRQWLIRELSARACFMRSGNTPGGNRRVDCPSQVAAAVELGTRDLTFNNLAALTVVPYLRDDGSVCLTPGYDPVTQIYYAPNLDFPPIPEAPTLEDARQALDQLKALVVQFPFANDASRSVFLADVLTAIARPMLPTSPAVLYTATMAGTGKTLMASIANLIAYGHGTTHPWPHGNEEELKKVFTSILIAGDPVVVFDNLQSGSQIKSAALSQFTTSDDYADRKLGESERVKLKNRTRVVLTGNNVTLASDNARRTLVCELQLNVESPRDRKIEFVHPDLQGHIKANRPALITAALTVLRAYEAAGRPARRTPLESFEQWSWQVRDALIWLGEADPVAAVQFDNDGSGDIAEAFREILVVAKAKARDGAQPRFRANELANWASNNINLRNAIEEAGCSDPSNSAKVGYWLRSLRNRIAGGLRLEANGSLRSRVALQWQLVSPTHAGKST